MWTDIATNYPLFDRFTKFQAICGKSIRFWEDVWCDRDPLKDSFLDLYLISSKKDTSIHDCWDNSNQTWNLGIRRGLFDRELSSWADLIEKLDSVQLGSDMYKIIWQLDGLGVYTTKSVVQKLSNISPKMNSTITTLIWKHRSPKKVKVYLWSLVFGTLLR